VITTILRDGVSWASPAGTSSASQSAERVSIVPSLGFSVTSRLFFYVCVDGSRPATNSFNTFALNKRPS
jgi:hypothetical protein